MHEWQNADQDTTRHADKMLRGEWDVPGSHMNTDCFAHLSHGLLLGFL